MHDIVLAASSKLAKLALARLREAGVPVHADQGVCYVVLRGDAKAPAESRVMPADLLDASGAFAAERPRPDRDHYIRLLARSTETLLAPLGYTEARAEALLRGAPDTTQPSLLSYS